MKTAFITGITGQDGSYLAELLLEQDYRVVGMARRSSTPTYPRLHEVLKHPNFSLEYGDLSDSSSLFSLLAKHDPDQIYNLAAQSHVRLSFDVPESTAQVDALGVANLLEAFRQVCPEARFYQASSSEMYGSSPGPQDEGTRFNPVSPYGAAKLFAHNMCKIYRESYGLYICCGILFNHESPRRGDNFVTRKITQGIANIVAGRQTHLTLGNLDAQRDWGYAPEYVQAMHLMLLQKKPDDYVIATGRSVSVRYFLETVAEISGLGAKNIDQYIKIDPSLVRPTEVNHLLGKPLKAKVLLGWRPKTTVEELANIMYKSEFNKETK